MNKILFFADTYWEIHWLYNVIKALDGVVFSENETVLELCQQLKIKTTNDKTNWQVIVMCNMHMGRNWEINEHFLNTGGKSIILQHAWDSGLNLSRNFWAHDMSRFTYYLVGCSQDEDWLGSLYGHERVLNLGMPRLDNLFKIKNEAVDISIYQTIGLNSFLLSMSPSNVLSEGVYRDYAEQLVPNSTTPILFKLHPGNYDLESTRQGFLSQGKDFNLVADVLIDPDFTYKLIKASSGVVCLESFLSIEASLLERPVVFHGYDYLPPDFYNRDENINQKQRAPLEMSSSLSQLQVTDKQREMAQLYKCDGQNTFRVVTFLKQLYNSL